MRFTSPTKGRMEIEQVIDDVANSVRGCPESEYNIIVGTDSQVRDRTCFVTVIILHKKGKGARYFYRKNIVQRAIKSLRQKIFFETSLSLECGGLVSSLLTQHGLEGSKVEIHIDVGNHGATKDLIKEVVGMVTGSGFKARIKPNAFGASSVADNLTKAF